MTSRHGCLFISQSKRPLRMKQCSAGTVGPGTSLHNTRLSAAVVALFCPVTPRRQSPSLPILVPALSCGTAVDLNDGHIHGRRISNPIS